MFLQESTHGGNTTMSARHKGFAATLPVAMTMAVTLVLAACKKEETPAAAPAATSGNTQAPATEPAVAASVSAMSIDQLREAASKAYNENRLYAPAGNNAMEYYLALRDKQPGNASATSALADLMPMAVIAADQALAREDFEEAKRLIGLIGKADPNHPALGRLKTSLASGEAAAKKRAESMTAEEEAKRKAELAKQREEEQKKLQEQQRQQQALAEQQRQQQAAAEAEAERLRQQQAAAAEAERQRQQQAAQQAAQQQTAAPAPRPAAAAIELRPISQPGPKYPPAAQRAGVGGSVQVEYTVGTDGSVISARVVSSDAPRQFQRDFEREALAAVKRWRFQPVAQPVTSRRTIEFAM